jgi:hypothetical protein
MKELFSEVGILNLKDLTPYIIGVSAHIDEGVQDSVNQAGFHDLFSVPITVEEIHDEIIF